LTDDTCRPNSPRSAWRKRSGLGFHQLAVLTGTAEAARLAGFLAIAVEQLAAAQGAHSGETGGRFG